MEKEKQSRESPPINKVSFRRLFSFNNFIIGRLREIIKASLLKYNNSKPIKEYFFLQLQMDEASSVVQRL